MSDEVLTQDILKKLYNYDPYTGEFISISSRQGVSIGKKSGSLKTTGYRTISIHGKAYLTHRLAWLYVYGYFPENNIDHVNRDRSDCRIKNLRESSQSCNMRNTGNYKNNSSGVKGVSFYNDIKKWVAGIVINGKQTYIGRSKDFNEAVLYRLAVEQCLNWEGCDRSSPAYIYAIDNKLIVDRHPQQKYNIT